MISNNQQRPSIFVIVSNHEELILKELLAGIEEEGIPYDVKYLNLSEDTVLRDLYVESQKSRIGIAVAIINNRIILQNNKLKEEKPLIDITLTSQPQEKARIVGTNAARLYKVMPLKDIKDVNLELVEKIKIAVMSILKQQNIKVF